MRGKYMRLEGLLQLDNRRLGSKPAPITPRKSGLYIPAYPVVGIIKNNLDSTRAGRLQVFIPDYGGANENDPSNWFTVSYVSPFRGQTRQRIDTSLYIDSQIDYNNQYENSFQSYGAWFPIPDLNCKVLCLFANGDPAQGYWIGAIGDPFDSHMIPGIGAVTAENTTASGGYYWNPSQIAAQAGLITYIQLTGSNGQTEIPFRLPVSEPTLNIANSQPQTSTRPSKVQVVPHIQQTKNLGIQGLAFDIIRGTTSASSIRENPSQCFGISTPGRLSPFSNLELSTNLLSEINTFVNNGGNVNSSTSRDVTQALNTTYRTGGHQFVMDDGTVEGHDQGIRIRTSTGHMILMDDTNQQIYIVTANGNAWIEMTPSGRIDIFTANDYSVRSKGNINFHSDQNINFNANGSLNMYGSNVTINSAKNIITRSAGTTTLYSAGDLQVGAGGKLSLSSSGDGSFLSTGDLKLNGQKLYLNGLTGPTVNDPGSLSSSKQIEVSKQSGTNVWWQSGSFTSIASRAPAHEPWSNHEVNGIVTYNVQQGTVTGSAITTTGTGTSSGVRGTTKTRQVNAAQVAQQPITGAVCGLTKTQTQALFAQIAQNESAGLGGYMAQNPLGYAGKYQMGADALIGQGYMSPGSHPSGTTNLQAIDNPANWTGLNGCNSVQDFLNNPSAQESCMLGFTMNNCSTLKRLGVITVNSTPDEIGGYLMCSHLIGPGGAEKLYQLQNNQAGGADGHDANGTTGSSYYMAGSQAVALGTSIQNA